MSHSRTSGRSVNPIDTLAYWRMSTDEQEASIPQQRQWGLDTCARDNLTLVYDDADPGVSGSEIEQRAGLLRIIARAEKLFREGRPARRLLVWKANRLSRADSCDTHALVIQPLRRAGVLHVQTQDGRLIDLYDRNDLLLFNIEQDAQSAAYLSGLASDVIRGKADIARLGFWNGGPTPYGYGVVHTGNPQFRRRLARLVLGPAEEVETLRWIFRTYHETAASTLDLARELNRRGVRPRKADAWTAPVIHAILSNRVYLGETRWNASHAGKFCRLAGGVIQSASAQERDERKRRKGLARLPEVRNDASDVIVVEAAHPPLVDPDVFADVQRKIAEQCNGERRRARVDRFYELTDLVSCGHCGAKCWVIPDPRGRRVTKTRMQCSRARKDGAAACPSSGTEHHGEILRRVMTILYRDLGSPAARDKIRASIAARTVADRSRGQAEADRLDKRIKALEKKKLAEARRILELPASIQESVMIVHQETIDALEQARADLAALAQGQTITRATLEIGEQALTMIAELPALAPDLDTLQAEAEAGEADVSAAEVLAIRRKVRDVLFALIGSVRLYYKPTPTAAERKGQGKGNRKHVLTDVELILRPHLQDVLLCAPVSGITSSHGSANWRIVEPIILRFSRPFAA